MELRGILLDQIIITAYVTTNSEAILSLKIYELSAMKIDPINKQNTCLTTAVDALTVALAEQCRRRTV